VGGGPETLVTDVPAECYGLALAPDASEIVCELFETRRDIHVIDGFDPQREVN
jgi:hypothetical protein